MENGQGHIYSYKTVKSILEKNLDQVAPSPPSTRTAGEHENVRGPAYYAQGGPEC